MFVLGCALLQAKIGMTVKAQSARDHIADAEMALKAGKNKEALEFANKAVESDSKNAEALHLRGCIHFKLGRFADSVKDFDRQIELQPKQKASHWQRGISCYYARAYEEGRNQFEGYQTHDKNDVENAVWRFMCMAKADGIEAARKDMLKIGDDRRVPMRQVYDLFTGTLQPDDVLAAARKGDPAAEMLNQQLFYAHLYVGIYFDLHSDQEKALAHLNKATDDHRIGHYMWDVARVHRDVLKKSLDKK